MTDASFPGVTSSVSVVPIVVQVGSSVRSPVSPTPAAVQGGSRLSSSASQSVSAPVAVTSVGVASSPITIIVGQAGNRGPIGPTGPAGVSAWGGITGSIASQADLAAALAAKQAGSATLSALASLTGAGYAKWSATGTMALLSAVPWVDLSGVPSSFAPSAHASSHLAGGADAIPWTTIHGRGTTAAKPAASASNSGSIYYDTTLSQLQRSNGSTWESIEGAGGGGGGTWGSITGTLSDQADLQTALNGKQASAVSLAALATITPAADRFAYFDGTTTAAYSSVSAVGRGLIACVTVEAARAHLGLGTAALNNTGDFEAHTNTLTAIAGLTGAADRLPYFTGLGTAALATVTAFGRSLVDDADAATARATLGLGGAAVLSVGSAAGTVCAGDDARLTNSRTPSAHAASHVAAGGDALTLAQSQITGLATGDAPTFAGLALYDSTRTASKRRYQFAQIAGDALSIQATDDAGSNPSNLCTFLHDGGVQVYGALSASTSLSTPQVLAGGLASVASSEGVTAAIQSHGASGGDTSSVHLGRWDNIGTAARLIFSKGRSGTVGVAAGGAVTNGTQIANILSEASDGTSMLLSAALRTFAVNSDGNVITTGKVPTRWAFLTMNSAGSLAERMGIWPGGGVSVNTITDPGDGYLMVASGDSANSAVHPAGLKLMTDASGSFAAISPLRGTTSTRTGLAFLTSNATTPAAVAWLYEDGGLQLGGTFGTSPGAGIFKAAGINLSAANLVTDTATGTKIGTATGQKLGFWNATPVIQPAAAGQAVWTQTQQALTDNSGGTAGTTIAAISTVYSQTEVRNAIATLAAQLAKIKTDVAASKTLSDAIRTALVNTGIMKGAA